MFHNQLSISWESTTLIFYRIVILQRLICLDAYLWKVQGFIFNHVYDTYIQVHDQPLTKWKLAVILHALQPWLSKQVSISPINENVPFLNHEILLITLQEVGCMLQFYWYLQQLYTSLHPHKAPTFPKTAC